MPLEVQRAYLETLKGLPVVEQPRSLIPVFQAPSRSQAQALQRSALLALIEQRAMAGPRASAGRQEKNLFPKLIDAFDAGVLDKGLRDALGEVSLRTYYRWHAAYQSQGLAGLLPGRGGGRQGLPAELRRELEALVWERPRTSAKIYEYLRLNHQDLPSYRTIHRCVKRFRQEHEELLTLKHGGGRAWKRAFRLSLGRASGAALAPNDLWEIDTTVADVLTKEGRRSRIIAVIDVFSRRAKLRLFKTSCAWGIAQTLRAAILDWGIPKALKMDNGLDYQSKLVAQVCRELGIETPRLPPYAPEAKPHIERFFRTLSEDLFAELTGYTGNCLARRPEVIVKGYSADELQGLVDKWIENVYEERVHRGTDRRPREAFLVPGFNPKRIGERELDLLLMLAKTRRVQKCRIRHSGLTYYHPELINLNGKWVEVRIDMFDAGRIFVFLKNRFVCVAEDVLAKGMTPQEIIIERQRQRKNLRQRLEAELSLAQPGQLDSRLHALLEAGARGCQPIGMRRVEAVTVEKYQEALRDIAGGVKMAEGAEPEDSPIFMSECERYEWLLNRRARGAVLPEEELVFMAAFESSPLYEGLASYYRRYGAFLSTKAPG
jgi:transposase InsO family protein